ncbi:MAG: DUF3365 domain-containing protein [Thermodesulfobacteriota bacterium]
MGLLLFLWFGLVGASLLWYRQEINGAVTHFALAEARSSFDKDILYRHWGAMHGGVYVPVSATTPPNPYLVAIPDRDVVTTSGKRLTLVNPAYMTRQVYEFAEDRYKVRGHITSLDPLRPENAADAWEKMALESFARGVAEVSSVENMDGERYLRFMRPMITEEPCLKCHGSQGYKVGDIRGGISVSVPIAPYVRIAAKELFTVSVTHLFIALLGGAGLVFGFRRVQGYAAALRQEEEKYRVVAEYTSDWEFWLSPAKTFRYVSPACLQVTGRSAAAFLADAELMVRIVHPDDRQAFAAYWAVAHLQQPAEMKFRIVRPDGGVRHIGLGSVPMINARGEFLGNRGCNRDITELQRNEERLRARLFIREFAAGRGLDEIIPRALAEAEKLTDSSTSFFVLLDDGVAEARAKCWSGRTEENCAVCGGGTNHPLDEGAGIWADCIRQRRPLIVNDYPPPGGAGRLPPGHIALRRLVAVPVLHEGRPVAMVCLGNKDEAYGDGDVALAEDFFGTVWDIVRGKLEDQIKNRLEIQLRQAQKMEAIGTLAGGIAHDFNNILTAIIGYAELAALGAQKDSPLQSHLLAVLRAGERAKELVGQILAFSRSSEQQKRPLRLHLILKEAIKLLSASLPSTIEIREEIDPDCGAVLIDPTQMHQLVMNLCTNAYHAMRETGGVLAVSLGKVRIDAGDPKATDLSLQPGAYVKIEVSDTGVGMDRETMARIFDPYFTTKPKGVGTGLGLALVHGIVKSAGGHISVYSEVGRGTTFRVYLPQLPGDVDEVEVEEAEGCPGGDERILAVDDEAEVVALEKVVLEGLGYRVTTRTGSQEALALFREDPQGFDLVLTDMTMPAITGMELAREILAVRPEMPIILCTGFSELIDREKAKGMGIRGYLMKPVRRRDLARMVRAVLGNRPA